MTAASIEVKLAALAGIVAGTEVGNQITGQSSQTTVLADAASRSGSGQWRWMPALPGVIALLVLGAYAVLWPAGRWQADEYLVSWQVSRQGWAVFLDRVQGWSPRPVGEFATFLYCLLVNALNRPVIGYYLGFLWLLSLALVSVAGWVGRVAQPVRLAVLLLALTLLLARPGEMFYWPMGASAYLPCWAGLAAAGVLHRGDGARHGVALSLALLLATLSAEVGAVTVLIYAVLLAAASWRDRSLLPGLVAVALPALAAVAVCLTVLGHRAQANEVFDATSGTAGHWLASLAAAVPRFAAEAVGVPGMPVLVGLAIKLALLASLPIERTGTARGRRLGALWGVALLLGAFVSIVAAYHQFGLPCCERHATLRQAMILLALSLFALLLGARLKIARHAVLAAAMVLLLAVRIGPLSGDWRQLGAVIAARHDNWQAATSAGDAMTLLLVPGGHVTNSGGLPVGTYRRPTGGGMGDAPWYAWAIMERFDKHVLTITDGR